MDYLLKVHEARGDKIIVFSESISALSLYAEKYKAVAICGSTPMTDRETFIAVITRLRRRQ
jgi:DNA excision repair protein ERCC-3